MVVKNYLGCTLSMAVNIRVHSDFSLFYQQCFYFFSSGLYFLCRFLTQKHAGVQDYRGLYSTWLWYFSTDLSQSERYRISAWIFASWICMCAVVWAHTRTLHWNKRNRKHTHVVLIANINGNTLVRARLHQSRSTNTCSAFYI